MNESRPPLYSLILPLPPSTNHYYIHAGRRRIISAAGERFRQEVAGCLLQQIGEYPLLTIPLRYDAVFYMKRGDADNRLKPMQDALNNLLWLDDRQIDAGCFERRKPAPKQPEYMTLKIWSISP